MINVQNILQCFRVVIAMMPTLITSIVSNKENNLISDTVGLPKDMPNSYHDEKAEEALDIMEDRIGVQILRPRMDPANNSGRITLKHNLPRP